MSAQVSAWAKALALRCAREPSAVPTQAFIALDGDLGAGKTSCARALLHALGVKGRIKSPTYPVLESYDTPHAHPLLATVHHFDFYRIAHPDELDEAGFGDIFAGPGLKLAEWSASFMDCLPMADVVLALRPRADALRNLRCTAQTLWGLEFLQAKA